MKKLIALCLFIAILAGAVFEFMAPDAVSRMVEKQLTDKFTAKQISVTVSARPNLKLLLGQIDVLKLSGKDVKIDDLVFSDLDFDLQDVKLNPLSLWLGGKINADNTGSGTIRAVLTEDALRQFLINKVHNISDPSVVIDDEMITVQGDISIANMIKQNVSITGRVVIDGTKIVLKVDRVVMEGIGIGIGSAQSAISDITLCDFKAFPVPLTPTRLTMKDGQIYLYAESTVKK
jgi:hypothetical protein